MKTKSELNELFLYSDGDLIWKEKRRGSKVVAGCVSEGLYKKVRIDGVLHYLHRVVFCYHHGYCPEFIDHIDCNKLNNKIENLRATTKSGNSRNSSLSTANVSGVKGVCWDKDKKLWSASLIVNGRKIFIGRFWDLYTAKLSMMRERSKYHGEFANHGIN